MPTRKHHGIHYVTGPGLETIYGPLAKSKSRN